MRVVQFAVMEVIDVIVVADGRVVAVRAVLVVIRVAADAVTSVQQVISCSALRTTPIHGRRHPSSLRDLIPPGVISAADAHAVRLRAYRQRVCFQR